jgi:putative GTP pyrophosphokinase
MIQITYNEEKIIQELQDVITQKFDGIGLFYRLFARIKSAESIAKKLKEKESLYRQTGKKIQDIFGVRVTLYFTDDEAIAINLVRQLFEEISEDSSIDKLNTQNFGATRCNLIFKIPKLIIEKSSVFSNEMTDSTVEIQFRTILSEGWHEIEHDLRYKCKGDWDDENELSRQLNGQYAVLESCNWTILKIFDELAYKKYKDEEWSSFFRNIMRIRFIDDEFSPAILEYLDSNSRIGKALLKLERNNLLMAISKLTTKVPLKLNTVLFIINRNLLHDPHIQLLEPPLLKQILDASFAPEAIEI